MTSNVLSSLGLGNIDIGYILIGSLVLFLILLVLLIVTMVKQSKLKKRYEAFMLGSDAKSMEEEISGLFQDINTLKGETKDNKKEIKHIYRRLETVFQKIGIVKSHVIEAPAVATFIVGTLLRGKSCYIRYEGAYDKCSANSLICVSLWQAFAAEFIYPVWRYDSVISCGLAVLP